MRKLPFAIAATLMFSHTLQAEDLSAVYELAKASDPQVQIASTQVKQAEEGVVQARSALLPRANASAGYNKSDSNRPFRNPDTQRIDGQITSDSTTRSYGVDISQTIYDHSNYTRLKAARVQVERANQQLLGAEQALMLRVSQAYFTALTAQDSVTSAKAEEKAVGRQLEQAEQRYNVGLTAITDVHEARARFDGAVAAAILAENQLDDAKAALTELTGKIIDSLASVQEQIPLTPPQPADWQDWVDTALKNSPSIAAAQSQTKAAEFNIQTAKSAFYPTVSATLGYDKSKSDSTDTTPISLPRKNSSEGDGKSLGISVNIPLFAGFANQSRVRQAVNDSETAKDQLESERRTITRQTRNAYRSVLAGVSEVKARQQALVSAKSALEATEAGFEVGTRTIVDVLLSQQVLFQAQRDYSSARHNFLVNGLRLKSSAGTIKPEDLRAVNQLLESK